MTTAPLLSVVVPTRNEGGNVARCWSGSRPALAGVDREIVFVDDSDDGTRRGSTREPRPAGRVGLVARAGAERAGGLSTAVVSGMRLARGQFVCVMDADLQHPPETIPRHARCGP